MGIRVSGGLVNAVAIGADGGAIANFVAAFTMPTQEVKRLVIRKIMWRNRTGGNANLFVGYGDRTAVGSLFRRVMPLILMINGFDGELDELNIPIAGNRNEGFVQDATIPTGTNGNIMVGTDAAAVGVGTPVEVTLEVEMY